MKKKKICNICGHELIFRRKKWNREINGTKWTNYYCENCGNHT